MTFKAPITVTQIGTATAIIKAGDATFLTDPAFDPAGTEYDILPGVVLKKIVGPALPLTEIPPVDLILLSHEDHVDNLDTEGRRFLDGRAILTTKDGAKNLAPRPGVTGMSDWEHLTRCIGGTMYEFTAIPTKHMPGGDCIGFVISSISFGETNGLPNALYFTGDTISFQQLYQIKDKWHISLMLINLGNAHVPGPEGPLQVTMDATSAADLIKVLQPDVVIPQHFDSWSHFTESSLEVKSAWQELGVQNVRVGELGQTMEIF